MEHLCCFNTTLMSVNKFSSSSQSNQRWHTKTEKNVRNRTKPTHWTEFFSLLVYSNSHTTQHISDTRWIRAAYFKRKRACPILKARSQHVKGFIQTLGHDWGYKQSEMHFCRWDVSIERKETEIWRFLCARYIMTFLVITQPKFGPTLLQAN